MSTIQLHKSVWLTLNVYIGVIFHISLQFHIVLSYLLIFAHFGVIASNPTYLMQMLTFAFPTIVVKILGHEHYISATTVSLVRLSK